MMTKNLLTRLLFFGVLLFSTLTLTAQSVSEGISLGDDFEEIFATFGALVAIIPVVTEFLKKLFKIGEDTPGLLVQLFSWATGLVVAIFGGLFDFGFLAGLEWYWVLLYGFAASLAANGIADTKLIKWIVTTIIEYFSPKRKGVLKKK